jgi:hypothetical protein
LISYDAETALRFTEYWAQNLGEVQRMFDVQVFNFSISSLPVLFCLVIGVS